MALLHQTGISGAPVPVYYESFAPETPKPRATVLMIHGGAHSGACYQRTADGRPGWAYRFATRGYRAVVPDWPGIGRSGHVPLDSLGGETVVQALGVLLRNVAASLGAPLILLTHSMSGAYGWRLLELHGDIIAAVVAVAPAPPGNIQKLPPVYEETETFIETQASGRRVRVDKTQMVVQPRAFVEHKLVGESRFFPQDQIEDYAASLLPIAPKLLLERQNLHGTQLRVSDPKTLEGKRVLVVTGTADLDHAREVDGAIVTWLNGHGAKAEFCYLGDRGIVGNGHMLMLEENSDDIADMIMDWIDTLSPVVG